jgi:hypothetical protein
MIFKIKKFSIVENWYNFLFEKSRQVLNSIVEIRKPQVS